jgi:hypothetical protein
MCATHGLLVQRRYERHRAPGAGNKTGKTLGMGATQFESVHCARSTPFPLALDRTLLKTGQQLQPVRLIAWLL